MGGEERRRLTRDLIDVVQSTHSDAGAGSEILPSQDERYLSSARVGTKNRIDAWEDFAELSAQLYSKLRNGENAPSAHHVSVGCKLEDACITDLAIVQKVVEILEKLATDASECPGKEPAECSQVRDQIAALHVHFDGMVATLDQLSWSTFRHIEKHGFAKNHADRAVHAENGGKLAKRYAKQARRLTAEIRDATMGLQKLVGGDKAKAFWGEFLFDAIVDEVILPGIIRRRECPDGDAWKHIDVSKHEKYRASCRAFNADSRADPFAFMAMHLAQAYSMHKAPVVNESILKIGPLRPVRDASTFPDEFLSGQDDVSRMGIRSSPPGSIADSGVDQEILDFSLPGGDQVDGVRDDRNVPDPVGGIVSNSHNTNINIMGDINIGVYIGHDGVQAHTDNFVKSAGTNGLAFPLDVFHSRLEAARHAVNTALDMAKQRVAFPKAPAAPKAREQFDNPLSSRTNRSSYVTAMNGAGRLFSDVESRPAAVSTPLGSIGVSGDVPSPYIYSLDSRVDADTVQVTTVADNDAADHPAPPSSWMSRPLLRSMQSDSASESSSGDDTFHSLPGTPERKSSAVPVQPIRLKAPPAPMPAETASGAYQTIAGSMEQAVRPKTFPARSESAQMTASSDTQPETATTSTGSVLMRQAVTRSEPMPTRMQAEEEYTPTPLLRLLDSLRKTGDVPSEDTRR